MVAFKFIFAVALSAMSTAYAAHTPSYYNLQAREFPVTGMNTKCRRSLSSPSEKRPCLPRRVSTLRGDEKVLLDKFPKNEGKPRRRSSTGSSLGNLVQGPEQTEPEGPEHPEHQD